MTLHRRSTSGDHELRVRAVDPAGNADPTPATYAWTVGAAPVPDDVFCGQVITQSILVRNDLTTACATASSIGADGITIDLDGHTIDGKGLGAGIRNDGYDSVTIKQRHGQGLRLRRRAEPRHARATSSRR